MDLPSQFSDKRFIHAQKYTQYLSKFGTTRRSSQAQVQLRQWSSDAGNFGQWRNSVAS
jgi:hypothetical protein